MAKGSKRINNGANMAPKCVQKLIKVHPKPETEKGKEKYCGNLWNYCFYNCNPENHKIASSWKITGKKSKNNQNKLQNPPERRSNNWQKSISEKIYKKKNQTNTGKWSKLKPNLLPKSNKNRSKNVFRKWWGIFEKTQAGSRGIETFKQNTKQY